MGDEKQQSRSTAPPEAWGRARDLARSAIAPIEHFLHVEAASGIILIIATVLALTWANSPWASWYEKLWHTEVALSVGTWTTHASVHFLINEGLMTLFFFVVGLEIRREIHHGELSRLKSALLPVVAALGGMIAPGCVYLLFNSSGEASGGWGIPMATDIAFAVGVLALLGKRVPPALRVLLLALAIIDDVGAILVIAFFFSKGIAVEGVLIVMLAIAAILLLQRFGVRQPFIYIAPGAVLWLGLLKAGIHPTIGGVIAGLLTPVKAWFGPDGFVEVARQVADVVEHDGHRAEQEPAAVHGALRKLGEARRETLAPGTRLQLLLHPWVSFVIMPIFAFANAGVRFRDFGFDAQRHGALMLGIVVGLVVGKPVGIMLASFIAVKARLAALPTAVTWKGVLLVGLVAGIGFTMAIFMAGLAFPSDGLLATAKLSVLFASIVAAGVALLFGRITLKETVAACTAAEAEASSVD